MEINICTSANSKYVRYLYVMLTSLLMMHKSKTLNIYILQRDFTSEDKEVLSDLVNGYRQRIFFVDVDEASFESLPVPGAWTMETYFRLMMPYLFPRHVARVIYLDVDVVVMESLEDLFQTDLQGNYVAACVDMCNPVLDARRQELFRRYDDLRYFNAGVMLWDLERIREHYSFNDFMLAAKELKYELRFVDQDILNYMLFQKVLWMDAERYNYLADYARIKGVPPGSVHPAILHFAGCNPWKLKPKSPMNPVWWDYARKTPFYAELMEEQMARLEADYAEKEERKNVDLWNGIYQLKWKIEESLKKSTDGYCIYGAGKRAQKLLGFLDPELLKEKIVAVIDRKQEGEFLGIPICRSVDMVDPAAFRHVIVTPIKDAGEIAEELRTVCSGARVATIEEFLKQLG